MPLTPGTRLGAYEILSLIGIGGMGEVYRARDRKLDRDVAIKVLPDSVATDAERLARFEREAKTLATLNHQNIAQIYGVEDSTGVPALVMELVEGPTLAERIAKVPIPLDEALPIPKQIAEGLEAAHEQHIIHRDLKPANIKVTPNGMVKVLDFGLAKAMEPVGATTASASLSPTIVSPAMTQAGMILGTAAYMSPEQARGLAVDNRADLWAFGCVVYEMLAGRRAFEGDDVTITLANIVRGEPVWGALPADSPAAVRRLLRRCLVKDPKRRLRDASSAILEIDDVPTELKNESIVAAIPRSTSRWRVVGVAIASATLGMTVAGGLGLVLARRPSTPSQIVRFSIPLGATNFGTPTRRLVTSSSPRYTRGERA